MIQILLLLPLLFLQCDQQLSRYSHAVAALLFSLIAVWKPPLILIIFPSVVLLSQAAKSPHVKGALVYAPQLFFSEELVFPMVFGVFWTILVFNSRGKYLLLNYDLPPPNNEESVFSYLWGGGGDKGVFHLKGPFENLDFIGWVAVILNWGFASQTLFYWWGFAPTPSQPNLT